LPRARCIVHKGFDFSLDGVVASDIVERQSLLAQVRLIRRLDGVVPGGAQYSYRCDCQNLAASRAEHRRFSAGNWWAIRTSLLLILPRHAFLRHTGLNSSF